MQKHFLQSTLFDNGTDMHVWRYVQRNRNDVITHFITVKAIYHANIDCYELTIRQEPYKNSNKWTKIIKFVVERKHMDNLLQIAKLKGE